MATIVERDRKSGWGDILWGDHAAVSAVLAGGISLHAVNINISATMLPSVVSEIGGQGLYAWNATLFTLAAILAAAMTGRLIRWVGARGGFAVAGLVFAIGSLIAATAPSMPAMLVGRVIQGSGGGMMFTLCYSMIVFVYPERLWSRAMALLSGTWGIMMLFGPAVGGIFAEIGQWRMGFGVLLPITGLFVLLALWLVPPVARRDAPAEPIAFGQLALLAGSVLLVTVGSLAPTPQWAAVGLLGAVAMVIVLMRREETGRVRLFPRGAMTPGSVLFLAFGLMALLIFCVNAEFFMPFYLQRLHGLSPLTAGYIAALVSVGWAASEVYSARLTGRRMRRAVFAGPLLIVAGSALLGYVTPMYAAAGPLLTGVMALALVLLGLGVGIGWPHLNTFVLQFTNEDERDMAASALSTVQMFAVAFGTAVAGLVANLSGFNSGGDTAGIARSAVWLFATFLLVATPAILASRALIARLKD